MAIASKLQAFLDKRRVPYQLLKHHDLYNSQEIAKALHVRGKSFAKVVIAKIDDHFIMIVLPSNYLIDLAAIASALNVKDVQLANEKELQELFPDCEIGAMPIFGNLYGLRVYIDNTLFEAEELVFEAGNHREAIKIAYRDFEMLVRPEAIDLIQHKST